MAIAVVGGAGYIGSHVVRYLISLGEEVIVIDNLQTGHKKDIGAVPFYEADIRDKKTLLSIFQKDPIESVMHFAANSIVPDSLKNPLEYYHNNVYGTLCLLDVMKESKVCKIVFSSSAAVYGKPKKIPILEDDPKEPTNTYGETKLAMERMMSWFEKAYGIHYTALRYFNAAGAHENGDIGEIHQPETHLIPLVLQTALGCRENICVFGTDYSTSDGTCIRDYIHVMDIAYAHYKALAYLRSGKPSNAFNLGNGEGSSVKEVIETAIKVTGLKIPIRYEARREGDPATLVASSKKAKQVLNWSPQYPTLFKIISDAWNFQKNNLNPRKIL